jgi:hypothetical protein
MTLELNAKRPALRAQSVSESEVDTDDAASTN